MKKTKIIAILSAFVMLTAMTGIAAAAPSTTVSPANVEVNVISNAVSTIAVEYTIDPAATPTEWSPDGICVNVTKDTAPFEDPTDDLSVSWDGSNYYTGEDCTSNVPGYVDNLDGTRSWTWTLYVKDATDTDDNSQVGVLYTAVFGVYNTTKPTTPYVDGTTLPLVGGSNTVIDAIPEFTTIAIPAVAILGLFLFFNHRKHKKE